MNTYFLYPAPSYYSFSVPVEDPFDPNFSITMQDNFQNLKLIGSGVYGNVYLKPAPFTANPEAKDLAIKVTKYRDFHLLSQALDEVYILQKVGKKPHLITYLGFFAGYDYVTHTTEYIPGISLSEAMIKSISFSALPKVLSIGRQIASALGTLGDLNVIHGDINPRNVLVRGEEAVLIDLGLAIDLQSKPYNDHIIYSIDFRPPEVILDVPVTDNRSDVWAFGIMLVAAFTKRYPITSTDNYAFHSQFNTLLAMNELIGPPPLDFVQRSFHRNHFFLQNKTVFKQPGPMAGQALPLDHRKFDRIDKVAREKTLDSEKDVAFFHSLLRKMLTWDPEYRISPWRIVDEIQEAMTAKL